MVKKKKKKNRRQGYGGKMDCEDSSGEEFRVMSEVHLGCPPGSHGPHLSRFTISLPLVRIDEFAVIVWSSLVYQNSKNLVKKLGVFFEEIISSDLHTFWMTLEVESGRFDKLFIAESSPSSDQEVCLDEDGDLVLPRRSGQSARSFTVTIKHNITSTIPDVGLQVWKAELILSDFVLHKMCTSSELNGIVSVELGAGTGLVGILLALVAKTVFLTDYGDEILDNCAQNVGFNSALFNSQAAVKVRELNWMSQWPIQDNLGDYGDPKRYSWNSLDLDEVKSANFICAADVIYSDDLTDALFSMLARLMSMGSEKVLYLALEKRYNFSLEDLDIVANGYARFRSYVREVGDLTEQESRENETERWFVGKRIDITQIPRYVKGYERGKEVELWEIRYVCAKNLLDPKASTMY